MVPSSRSSPIALAPMTTATNAVTVGSSRRWTRRAQKSTGSTSPAAVKMSAATIGRAASSPSAIAFFRPAGSAA